MGGFHTLALLDEINLRRDANIELIAAEVEVRITTWHMRTMPHITSVKIDDEESNSGSPDPNGKP